MKGFCKCQRRDEQPRYAMLAGANKLYIYMISTTNLLVVLQHTVFEYYAGYVDSPVART